MAFNRHQNASAFNSVLDLPEFNIAIFAFLLNFVWEFWQIGWFAEIGAAPHLEGVKLCTRATVGDVGIALVAFWAVSFSRGTTSWVSDSNSRDLAIFVLVGVVLTILLEWLATSVLDRWAYAESMPRLPVLGTGILPLMQWIVIPPLILWFVRRQVN